MSPCTTKFFKVCRYQTDKKNLWICTFALWNFGMHPIITFELWIMMLIWDHIEASTPSCPLSIKTDKKLHHKPDDKKASYIPTHQTNWIELIFLDVKHQKCDVLKFLPFSPLWSLKTGIYFLHRDKPIISYYHSKSALLWFFLENFPVFHIFLFCHLMDLYKLHIVDKHAVKVHYIEHDSVFFMEGNC